MGLSTFLKAIGSFILPPTCVACRQIVASPQGVCRPCFDRLSFIEPPCCAGCGFPFDALAVAVARSGRQDPLLCASCMVRPFVLDGVRAPLTYDGLGADLVLRLKHGDRPDLSRFFARFMVRAAHDLWGTGAVLIPVPLHRWRLFYRRYNQATCIAQEIARKTKTPLYINVLRRSRSTPSMGHLSPRGRRRNVHGAFSIPGRLKTHLKGQKVILIDDVMTTGATLNECAKVLKAAGAKTVHAVTACRVIKPRPL